MITVSVMPPPLLWSSINPFMPTVPTFAVRETDSGAPLKPLRDDSALRALSSLSSVRSSMLTSMMTAKFGDYYGILKKAIVFGVYEFILNRRIQFCITIVSKSYNNLVFWQG